MVVSTCPDVCFDSQAQQAEILRQDKEMAFQKKLASAAEALAAGSDDDDSESGPVSGRRAPRMSKAAKAAALKRKIDGSFSSMDFDSLDGLDGEEVGSSDVT